MSCITALGIQGIRSFSPNDFEVIEFAKPLTVIVGANGCGKTTIIECLRYATTGQLPPGSDHGKSFVHDMRIADASDVKAQIRLKFKNRVPQSMVAIRNIQVTAGRGGDPKFQALDASLMLQDRDEAGNKVQRLHNVKPTQMDTEMPLLLDVPRAVLDHVIFCHQEESNWPLQEGKALKERFDQIFESHRYVKALEEIKSQRKEKEASRKQAELAVAETEGNLKRLREIRQNIERHERDIKASTDQVSALSEAVQSATDVVNGLEETKRAVEKARAEVTAVEHSLKRLDADIERAEKTLDALTGPEKQGVDSLRTLPREQFSVYAEKVKGDIKGLEREVTSAQAAETRATDTVKDLNTKKDAMRSALGDKEKAQAALRAARDELVSKVNAAASELAGHGFVKPAGADYTADQVLSALQACLEDVRNRMYTLEADKGPRVTSAKEHESATSKASMQADAAVTSLRQRLGEARNARAAATAALRAKEDVGASVDVSEAESDLAKATSEQETARRRMNDLGPQLAEADKRRKDAEDAVSRLRKSKDAAYEQVSASAQKDLLRKQLKEDEDDAARRFEKVKDKLTALFPANMPALTGLQMAVAQRVKDLGDEAAHRQRAAEAARGAEAEAERRYRDATRQAVTAIKTARDEASRWCDGRLDELWSALGLANHSAAGRDWLAKLGHVYNPSVHGDGDLEARLDGQGLAKIVPPAAMLPTLQTLVAKIASIEKAVEIHASEDISAESTLEDWLQDARSHLTQHGSCSLCQRRTASPAETNALIAIIDRQLKDLGARGTILTSARATSDEIVVRLVELGLSGDTRDMSEGSSKRQTYLEQARSMKASLTAFHAAVTKLTSLNNSLPELKKAYDAACEAQKMATATAQQTSDRLDAAKDVLPSCNDISTAAKRAAVNRLKMNADGHEAGAGAGAGASGSGRSPHAVFDDLCAQLEQAEARYSSAKQEYEELNEAKDKESRALASASTRFSTATTALARARDIAAEHQRLTERETETKAAETALTTELAAAEAKQGSAKKAASEAAARASELSGSYLSEKQGLESAELRLKDRIPTVQGIAKRMSEAEAEIRRADRLGAGNTQAAVEAINRQIAEAEETARSAKAHANKLQSDLRALLGAQSSIGKVDELLTRWAERKQLTDELERKRAQVTAQAMTILSDEEFRASCEAEGIDLSGLEAGSDQSGAGAGQAREAARRRGGDAHGYDEDEDVIDVDGPGAGAGGSKRRRVNPKSADELFTIAVSKFTEKRNELAQSMAEAKGRLQQLVMNKQEEERKLRDPSLRDAEGQYTSALAEMTVLEAAVRDLDTYYSALDKALMTFHSLKIKEINSTIADLWGLTYKGTDIEKIEIKSSAEGELDGSAAVSSGTGKTSRSYNYRVVMTKCGAELDMRGRCSAGQKVLASIVIRLALAESFCVNTGILALDEPTTNLDAANRKGLAEALSNIIQARSGGGNLQLVVITHDEDFVRELGRASQEGGGSSSENHMGSYYRVFREQKEDGVLSYSRIEKLKLEDLGETEEE